MGGYKELDQGFLPRASITVIIYNAEALGP